MSNLALLGGQPVRRTPFPTWPVYGEAELQGLQQVLTSGVWSAAAAPKVKELETRFAAYHDASHGIAVTNGTITLEIALRALGVGAGDEVIVPPYTFLATASAVLQVNALPVFVDIDPETYCIDPAAVEAAITPRTKAIIAVHLGGHPADMDRLLAIKEKHGLALIEDAAHAHGAAWKGAKVGALGDFGSWSFQGSKNMSSGEGGMLTTNDPVLAEKARVLQNCGRAVGGKWYEHFELGGNYRLTEFQSAILLAQLERLPEQVQRREASAFVLDRDLATIEGIRPLKRDLRATTHAYHLYSFRYDSQAFGGLSRDKFVQALHAEGIPASGGYPFPLTRQPLFLNRAFDTKATHYNASNPLTQFEQIPLPVCNRACEETVWLIQNVLLGTPEDMADVVAAVRKIQKGAGAL